MENIFSLKFQIMGSYWNTDRLTNGVAAQISATGFEDGSYDAEILHDILPGGGAELADTSCLNLETIATIGEESSKIEQQLYDIEKSNNNDGLLFAKQQKIYVSSRQFRKQMEVFTLLILRRYMCIYTFITSYLRYIYLFLDFRERWIVYRVPKIYHILQIS